MGYIEKTYGRSEKFLAFKVCFYDTLVPTREYKGSVRPELTSCPVIFTNCKIFAPLLD